MAIRPVFIPAPNGQLGVVEKMLDFKWVAGMAVTQKQKSIRELHQTASTVGISPVLEISSKSESELGQKLSAFNLTFTTKKHKQTYTVESAFQGSKVFENGGPFIDLMTAKPKDAKRDIRLKEAGNLVGFNFLGKSFPPEPKTFFYDWLYINALCQNSELADQVCDFSGFTDIEFNPKKSINCQGYAAALYLSLKTNNRLSQALASPSEFLRITREQYKNQLRATPIQNKMF
ncbi:hypothetical protein [Ferrimonas sp. SCSIO 43195]|uniref:DarT1-associated NADAR antitoxin family protein n=1 Tax=Ferrimonas sp. SCSIO 43195 TaxID=2822844 RepID=UPI0020763787|nr:hypothetical protein [Ferrimonas sp. SCSIO 43195]USD38555.1 hypothetical protein J8Z22_05360 [Ferrimonas sp. SCSIO 43195]